MNTQTRQEAELDAFGRAMQRMLVDHNVPFSKLVLPSYLYRLAEYSSRVRLQAVELAPHFSCGLPSAIDVYRVAAEIERRGYHAVRYASQHWHEGLDPADCRNRFLHPTLLRNAVDMAFRRVGNPDIKPKAELPEQASPSREDNAHQESINRIMADKGVDVAEASRIYAADVCAKLWAKWRLDGAAPNKARPDARQSPMASRSEAAGTCA